MGLKVLIVDDSVTMRRMIIRALKMTDLDVDEFLQAGNGQEGLDVLAQQSVDLALVVRPNPQLGRSAHVAQLGTKTSPTIGARR